MQNLVQNKAVAIKLLAEAMPNNDIDYVRRVVTPQAVTHRAGFASLYEATGFLIPKDGNFMEWMVQGWSVLHAALSNQTVTAKHAVADDDEVMLQYHMTALHQDNFAGMAATNKRIEWDEIGILKFNEAGKITDMWYFIEELKVATELGYQLSK
ncbi:hypothetical protein LFAB_16780 [Lactiplantibacillus fabifermentans T30PCM01]|uniref:SnoaL-like domain-containing protein n=1 Tax=Lactiplantibacillus fabifermentans T30PCM01 TaxID=1400520 RepID=W6T4H4_9LACO|nr:nuclear transport factor 2 family protein [Lactiplantibacillus fabifermentans]ETY72603.1 hypothetical protein LFAB_16780 [Lactiplantibacillus fabifermentans T30PCM01]